MTGLQVTEKQFMAQVIQLAKLKNWLVYHTFSSIKSSSGFPDLVLVKPERTLKDGTHVPGRVIFAELKTERGKVSPSQHEWLRTLSSASEVHTYLWRPSDFGEIEEALKGESC